MGARALLASTLIALTGCAAPAESPPPITAPHGSWPSASGPGRVDVAWSVARVADVARVEVRTTVEAGWHLYGLTSEYGVPPVLELELPPGASRAGALGEPPPVAELALDELPITAHRGTVAFVQSVTAPAAARVPARFRWQVCNDADTYCAPGVSEVMLILPGPDGRAPGAWEVGEGATVELHPPGEGIPALLVVALGEAAGKRCAAELLAGAVEGGVRRGEVDPHGHPLTGAGSRRLVVSLEPTGGPVVARVVLGDDSWTVVLPAPEPATGEGGRPRPSTR